MTTKVKFGVQIPTGIEGLMYPIPFAAAGDCVSVAVKAEELGYDSVWGNDHVSTQAYVKAEFGQQPRYYAPLLVLSNIAAQTERIKLGTALLVLPFRNPVVVAKEAATLDRLSGGRLVLGVGIGAYREEYTAMLGRDAARMRGAVFEESLECLQRLFAEEYVEYSGDHFDLRGVQTFPKPLQTPLPVYVGGNSPQGRRRAAQLAQGWLPAALTPEEVSTGVSEIQAHADKAGRELEGFEVALQLAVSLGDTQEDAAEKFMRSQVYKHLLSLQGSTLKGHDVGTYTERNLIGDADHIAARIEEYAEAGVTQLVSLLFMGSTVEEFTEEMCRFMDEVVSKF